MLRSGSGQGKNDASCTEISSATVKIVYRPCGLSKVTGDIPYTSNTGPFLFTLSVSPCLLSSICLAWRERRGRLSSEQAMCRPEEEAGVGVGERGSQVRWRELMLSSTPIPSPTGTLRRSREESAISRSGASVNVDSRPRRLLLAMNAISRRGSESCPNLDGSNFSLPSCWLPQQA